MVIGTPEYMTEERMLESMVKVLKRSFNNGVFTFSEVSEITRGTLTDKQIHVTMKRDKRMKHTPYLHIPVSHARCFDIEDIDMNDDGTISLVVTIKPERY